MFTDGTLISSHFHGHSAIFHSSYLIKASPAELGLDDPKFMPKYAFEPLDLSELGYDNIEEMATFLINHLDPKKSQLVCRGYYYIYTLNYDSLDITILVYFLLLYYL